MFVDKKFPCSQIFIHITFQMNRFGFLCHVESGNCIKSCSSSKRFLMKGVSFPGERDFFTKKRQAERRCDCLKHRNVSWPLFSNSVKPFQSNIFQLRSNHNVPKSKRDINEAGQVSQNRENPHLFDIMDNRRNKNDTFFERKKISFFEPAFDYKLNEILSKISESLPEYFLDERNDSQICGETIDFLENVSKLNCTEFRNSFIDNELHKELIKKRMNPDYINIVKKRQNLPSFEVKDKLLDLFENNQVVFVSGATGCGKSTQLVQYILDDFILNKKGSLCNIVCIVPRRVSAIALANRIAAERKEKLGNSIGYQIHLENKKSKRNRGCINFMTTGIFLRNIMNPNFVEQLSHIVVDEVHERSLDCDFALALIKILMKANSKIKILLMSATVNADTFCKYMNDAPHLEICSLLYPVEEYYLEDILKKIKFTFKQSKDKKEVDQKFLNHVIPYVKKIQADNSYPKYVTSELAKQESEKLNIQLIAETVRYICENEDIGSILIFVPGLMEIQALKNQIQMNQWYSADKHLILRMHSALSPLEQNKVFLTPPKGVWKIIISTTILETSVTIKDISYVIDTGKIKNNNFDTEGNDWSLNTTWISKSNALQRKGRAGRVKEGKCFKLYTRARENCLSEFSIPEFQSSSLVQTLLKAKNLNIGDIRSFLQQVIDPPDKNMIDASVKLLEEVGAVDSKEQFTLLGNRLSLLPLDPRLGKILLMGAIFSCIDPICSIVVSLSNRNPFDTSSDTNSTIRTIKKSFAVDKSDHLVYSQIMKEWEDATDKENFCLDNKLSYGIMRRLSLQKKYYEEILYSMELICHPSIRHPKCNINSANRKLLKAILCAGFFPNFAVLNQIVKKTLFLDYGNGQRVLLHSKSVCYGEKSFESPYFVFYNKLTSGNVIIHDVTMVDLLPLILFGKDVFIRNKNSGCVVVVGELIRVQMLPQTALQLQEMRNHINWIMEKSLQNPELLGSLHKDIISFIVELLSSESVSKNVRS